MRVVGALYGVTLALSTTEPQAGGPSLPPTKKSVAARETNGTAESTRAAHKSAKSATTATTASAARRRRVADTTPARSTGPVPPDNAEVRSWARQSGLAINDRGRIPASVMAAYYDSHG